MCEGVAPARASGSCTPVVRALYLELKASIGASRVDPEQALEPALTARTGLAFP